MKKSKLLLSTLGIGSIVTGLSTLSGCVIENPHQDEPVLTLTGVSSNLMCQQNVGGNVSPYGWTLKLDDKEITTGWQTWCDFIITQGPSNLYETANFRINRTNSVNYFYWDSISTPGVYKFKISTWYYDAEKKVTYRTESDEITLTVLSEGQKGVLPPPVNEITDIEKDISVTGLTQTMTIHGLTMMGANIDNLSVEMEEVVEPGHESTITFSNVYIDDPTPFEETPYYNVVADVEGLDIVEVGEHPITLTIVDPTTGFTYLNKYKMNLVTSFQDDSWENVTYYANKGIDALKEHYGIDNFVGLTKIINILGRPHKVRVVGQEHDYDEDGNLLPLTFEFVTPLEAGTSCPEGDEEFIPSALLTSWDEENKGNGHYWDSQIQQALNGDIYNNWMQVSDRDYYTIKPASTSQSFFQTLPVALARSIKPVQKTVTEYSNKQHKYISTTKTTALFLPTVASIFSNQAIKDSTTTIFTHEQKALILAEDTQYEYYQQQSLNNLWGSYAILNKEDYDYDYGDILDGSMGVCYWLATPYVVQSSTESSAVWTIQYNGDMFVTSALYSNPVYSASPAQHFAVAPLFCI